jgi:excisionase family DNA binding protein
MANIFLHEITPEKFKELFLEAFRETHFKNGLNKTYYDSSSQGGNERTEKDPFLTRQQAAKLLQISLPTLHQYTKDCLITSFRIGNKIRYKKNDLEKALTERNFGRRNAI